MKPKRSWELLLDRSKGQTTNVGDSPPSPDPRPVDLDPSSNPTTEIVLEDEGSRNSTPVTMPHAGGNSSSSHRSSMEDKQEESLSASSSFEMEGMDGIPPPPPPPPLPSPDDDDDHDDKDNEQDPRNHSRTTTTPPTPIDTPTTSPTTTTTITSTTTTTEEQEASQQQLQDIKADYEEQLALYAQRNATFKEKLRELSEVNYQLKQQLDDFKQNNQGVVRILNLEEEVAKWETLYEETAQVGAAKMKQLEEELEQLRGCLTGNESATMESLEQMENVCDTLVQTMEDMQTREREFNEYKRKSTERITMLTEMLDYVKTEKEKEVEHLKRKQIHEYTLMEKIENLEDEVQAKTAIIERERNQAMKREARLKEQLRKLQSSDRKATQDDTDKQLSPDLDFLDSACSTLSVALEGAFHWCGPPSSTKSSEPPTNEGAFQWCGPSTPTETSDPPPPPPNNDRTLTAPEEKSGSDIFWT